MRPSVKTHRRRSGFTIAELMVGMAIGSIVLAGVALTSTSLQRSFEAANYQMTAQNDQLRIFDYLSRDLHMASAVSILEGDGKLSLTVPTSDSALLTLNLGPLLNALPVGGTVGATTQMVSYYVEGGQFIREAAGVQTDLADTVAEVKFSRPGMFVTTSVVFTPRFSSSPTAAAQSLTRAASTVYLRNATLTN